LPAATLLAEGAPDFLDVTLLAVTQGLTEFLPISSSGHLVLLEHLLGLQQGGLALVVALHVGSLISVLAVYHADVQAILRDLFGGRPRMALLILLASVPAAVVGILFEDWIEARFADSRSTAWELIATGIMLAAAEFLRRRRGTVERPYRELTAPGALVIGAAQAVAILPGVSRSGATISASLALGQHPVEAARFSFMMLLVAIGGAALLEVRKLAGSEEGLTAGVPLTLWGIAVSAVVGWVALRLLLAFLGRGAFGWFAVYCVALGAGWLLFT
jgi:undecaprenyl-diphosphatase